MRTGCSRIRLVADAWQQEKQALKHPTERDSRPAIERTHPYRVRRMSVLLLLLLVAGAGSNGSAQSRADEYRVKAAFLFHFAQLVEWPPRAFVDDGNLRICTFGNDPFSGELESTVAGKQIGDRGMEVRHLRQSQEIASCHVLFIGKAEVNETTALLGRLQHSPVLTVGETDGFLSAGGIIRFCLEGNKVRFEINRQAAESAGLKISSRLLLLAKNVADVQGRE